jgi:hypothetical protein
MRNFKPVILLAAICGTVLLSSCEKERLLGDIVGRIVPQDANPEIFVILDSDTFARTSPDENGYFKIFGLRPGLYKVSFDLPELYCDSIQENVPVESGAVKDLGLISLFSDPRCAFIGKWCGTEFFDSGLHASILGSICHQISKNGPSKITINDGSADIAILDNVMTVTDPNGVTYSYTRDNTFSRDVLYYAYEFDVYRSPIDPPYHYKYWATLYKSN